ncbi:hypothetical protein ACFQ0B_42475 [Nonomuraea thailandensis]
MITLADYAAAARERLGPAVWDFVEGAPAPSARWPPTSRPSSAYGCGPAS